jgi:hypothetical protein
MVAVRFGKTGLKVVVVVCALLLTQQFFFLGSIDILAEVLERNKLKKSDIAVAGGSNRSQEGAVDPLVSLSDGVKATLDLVASPKNIKAGLLFHLIHSSGDDSFLINNMRVVEAVFYHHPDAHVKLHVPEDKR